MTSKDELKAQKKAAKAEAKREKKAALAAGQPEPPTTVGLSPSERSAKAAERQVRLQTYRVLFALLALAVAILTFLFTVRPWE